MAILPGGIKDRFEAIGNYHPVLDTGMGGSFGHMPVGGVTGSDGKTMYDLWLHSQPHVTRNMICFLLDYPRHADFFKANIRESYVAAIKALMESNASVIEGLNAEITVESAGVSFGGIGQEFKVPTNVTMASSEVSYTYPEIVGYSLSNILNAWITYGIMDAMVKHPNIRNFIKKEHNYKIYTADYYSCIAAYIVPDEMLSRAQQCWIVMNLYPDKGGSITGKRDKQSAGELISNSVNYGGIAFLNNRTRAIGTAILNSMQVTQLTPDAHFLPARNKISDVLAQAPTGYNALHHLLANDPNAASDEGLE